MAILDAPRLLPTSWTSAGNARPQSADERSPIPMLERIKTVAETGWNGFGLVHDDLMEFQAHHPLSELGKMLDDNGIEHLELEFLIDWWTDDERRTNSDVMRRNLFAAAETLGVDTVKIAPEISDAPVDSTRFSDSFDRLATEAAEHGTRVALEFLPFSTNMSTLEQGIDLVTSVANPSGGLCVDTWHVARAGTDYSVIRDRLPVEYVFVVELDDAAPETVGTMWEDTVYRRLLPGEGGFDVPEFINAIRAIGYSGIWGVEIISDHHRSLALEQALTETREATLRCFEEADRRLA